MPKKLSNIGLRKVQAISMFDLGHFSSKLDRIKRSLEVKTRQILEIYNLLQRV